jgi:Fe-S-cluster containining protein
MKIFARRPCWYADGLAFECVRCGRCCAGPGEGYVWVRAEDIDAIAEHLRLPVEQVRRRWVRRVGQRHSLVEEPRSKDCCFLRYDADGLSKCLVYPVRPIQCRTWPFWPANLVGPENWCLAGRRCPGINRGQTHTSDEIQRKRQQTNP